MDGFRDIIGVPLPENKGNSAGGWFFFVSFFRSLRTKTHHTLESKAVKSRLSQFLSLGGVAADNVEACAAVRTNHNHTQF
jgi:hypothetical protein